jgi:hypothetical protein
VRKAAASSALQECGRRPSLVPLDLLVSAIRKSSSFDPDRRAETSQRGCLPRPDQVSAGADGLQYFGRTFGYLRRGRSVADCTKEKELPASSIGFIRFNRASRFSNSSFSAAIFSARIFVRSSYKRQSPSKSIASKSNFLSIAPFRCMADFRGGARQRSHPACFKWKRQIRLRMK